MEFDVAMDPLKEILEELNDSVDDHSLQSRMSKLYNSLSACTNIEGLSKDSRAAINSLTKGHKRYMCVLALKFRSLSIFQLFFSNEIVETKKEDFDEDRDLYCELMCDGVNLYHSDLISAAIYSNFPDGIKFMCEHGAKFDTEILNSWCLEMENKNTKQGLPVFSHSGINKYKQLEDIARHFASRGDVDMLERMLGKNDEERSKARKYIKNVEQALVSVIDVDDCDDDGEDQALKCVEMFVSAGADVNKPASRIVNGFQTSPTPLMMAVFKGKPKIFEYLIQNGADVNRRDRLGENVLHYLINSKQDMTDCVDRIFSAGYKYEINTNKMIRIIYTPLHLAVVKNKIPLARKLIDQGADIFSLDRKGKNLIHQLAEIDVNDDSLEIAEFLIKSGLDKDLGDEEGHTPLFDAIKNKNTVLVKFLLEQECKIDTLCAFSTSSPLLMACDVYLSGQEDILLLLLDSKCDVNFANDRGIVALMKAAEYPSKDLASLLLKHGADVNQKDCLGMYATSYCFRKRGANASDSSCSEILKFLLDSGIDVQKHNKENQLILMSLVGGEYKCFDMVMGILNNYDEVTKTGETIFHFFARSKNVDLKKYEKIFLTQPILSQRKNKHGISPSMMAAFLLNTNYLEMAVKHGADMNDCNNNGHTPLHFSVIGYTCLEAEEMNNMHGSLLQCVHLLVEAGADVDMQDKSGKTVLMMAAIMMDRELIELLLEMGADVDYVEDEFSLSALQFLDYGNTRGHIFMNCLKILVSFGCDYALDLPYAYGDTLIQKQFRLIAETGKIFPYIHNIYCLLAGNSTVKKLNPCYGETGEVTLKTDMDCKSRDQFRKLLFLCGATVGEILSVVEPEEEELQPGGSLEAFLNFSDSITLQSRCRRVIRQNIGGNIKGKLEELCLPPGIQNFLLVNGESRVEGTFIPRKYFHSRTKSPEVPRSSENSQSEDLMEGEPGKEEEEQASKDYATNFQTSIVNDVNDFSEFFRWYSFSYIDQGITRD